MNLSQQPFCKITLCRTFKLETGHRNRFPICVEVHEATRYIFLHASEVKYEFAREEINTW
jgi:hypothetical protein